MPDKADLLAAALRGVADATAICREVQRNMAAVRAITKEDKSPVTVADYASQAVVAHRLQEALGSPVHLVGEETSAYLRNPEHKPQLEATLAAVRVGWPEADEDSLLAAIDVGASQTNAQAFWTLDPIDGTKGFLRGGQYAVSLAYIERGEVIMGLLGCPNLPVSFEAGFDTPDPKGCIYYAMAGQGAYELPADDPFVHPVKIERPRLRDESAITFCISVEEAHSDQSLAARLIDRFSGDLDPARLDSQAKYAVVARGQADVYFRVPTKPGYKEWIWDHAAGAIIAAECGIAVTDADGRELDFGKGRKLSENRGILAAPAAVHGIVLGALRELEAARH